MSPEAELAISGTGELAAAIQTATPAGEALLTATREALTRWQLAQRVKIPPWREGRFSQQADPANGIPSLRADFHSRGGQRIGHLLFHGDGSCYGEFDICLLHPTRPGWWIEAVEVWGRAAAIKSELRLLALPSDVS
jgi:hypothetical protein